MTYSVRILFLNRIEPLPSKQMESRFADLQEAWDAGTAEILTYQLRSIEAAFQVLDAENQVVEVTAKQVEI